MTDNETKYHCYRLCGRACRSAAGASCGAQANLNASFPFRAVGEPGVVATTIAQLRDAGAAILCGTDAPNPGTTFGASMHEELALLSVRG